jgi:ssDNA-binding Zn-finger/Zn-ribbon topoisomerase 1
MSDVKLLQCPFCGGDAQLSRNRSTGGYSVGCNDPKCKVNPCTRELIKKKQAIEIWNRRV